MGLAKVKYLAEDEVQSIADPILRNRFEKFGFSDTQINESEEYDGSVVFRLAASVRERVPAKALIQANHEIHVALRKLGEDRSVFLSTKLPDDGNDEADEEEE